MWRQVSSSGLFWCNNLDCLFCALSFSWKVLQSSLEFFVLLKTKKKTAVEMIHKNGGGGSRRNVKFCFAFSFKICFQESCFHYTQSMTDFIIPYEAKLVTRNPEVVLLLLLRLLAILSLRSIQTRK